MRVEQYAALRDGGERLHCMDCESPLEYVAPSLAECPVCEEAFPAMAHGGAYTVWLRLYVNREAGERP